MTQRKKKKQKKRSNGPFYTSMPRLFREDLSEEQRAEAITAIAATYSQKLDGAFEFIKDFVSKFHPLHALSVLATYGLTTSRAGDGRTSIKDAQQKITQDHVEYLQAMCLTIKGDAVPQDVARPYQIQPLWEALIDLGRGFDLSRMKPLDLSNSADAVVSIQERIRSHTRGIRNWGFYDQVRRIGLDALQPLDELLLARLGFSGTSLITVVDDLIRTNERRINEHRKRILPAIAKQTFAELVDSYSAVSPQTDCEHLLEFFERNNFTLEEARVLLLSHSEIELPNCYIHEALDVSERTNISVGEIVSIFRAIGLHPGDIAGRDPKKFLLDNPVWTAPLVLLSTERVFACIPQTTFSFLFEIVASILRPYPDALTIWQSRRADYLENETARLLQKSLPNANVHQNVEWRVSDSGVNGETDILVVADSLLLIVEAKSGAISASSKRGAPGRLKAEIKELIEAPSLQSQRLAAAINDHISGRATVQISANVQISEIKYIIRVSVTLDDFWTIQSDLGNLKRIGLISADVEPAPTICLTDLDAICELLDRPSLLLHYFHRRSQLEGKFSHDSDELDLLGGYLLNGLLFGDIETSGTRMVFLKMSEAVDRYMTARAEGAAVRKPVRHVSTWWDAILKRVEERRSPRWMELAIAILDIDDNGQRLLKANLKELVKKHRYQRTRPYLNSIVYISGGVGYAAVALLVLNNKNYPDRVAIANGIAERVFSDPRPQRCVVMGFNCDAPIYPYNFLYMADRQDIVDAPGG